MENHKPTMASNLTDNGTILVIGGTGKTGRRVAERLTDLGIPVRIGSRSGSPAFDWEDAGTWDAALDGITKAYVTYYPDLAFPGVSELIAEFAAAAVARGVEKIVLLSGRGEDGAVASEESVRTSGAAWTVVRCNWLNQNFNESFFLGPVLEGAISIPAGDAVEPFVDAEDIADVAVAALTQPGHDGQVYELSGPRLLGFHEVAREISAATGRDVVYSPVTAAEYEAILAKEGLPREFVDLFTLILDGRNATLADGVQRALGREPRDFREFAREAAATGVWAVAAEPVAREVSGVS
ncbi:NmrA family transcriptional regulator [Pseudarthrobacter sp. SSS035]|uniref:NmrA family transcriptional regulator n=1 Tax=Pseudarthrobacter sp. SSS035 TaxID=2931399 RepID=UPI00200C624A|nr:NmrA family transcriptional regulator [Pseudarthrobacter sp. SSS035]